MGRFQRIKFAGVPTRAYADRRLTPGDRDVLALICARWTPFADEILCPVSAIAETLAIDPRSVRRALRRLEAHGYLDTVHAFEPAVGERVNRYRVHYDLPLAEQRDLFDQRTLRSGGEDPTVRGGEDPTVRPKERENKKQSKEEKNIPRETWMTPYWTIWIERYGSPPNALAGQLAKYLRPLHNERGQEETTTRFRNYLAVTDASYISLSKFAATFASWNGHTDPEDDPGRRARIDAHLARMQKSGF